ncbi:MAG TPA: bifunctional nuclease family protein [Verrucomicrobiae bacterium]|nr:bifunctional nuclease family protein [Verrucomicrobiae bacterium]
MSPVDLVEVAVDSIRVHMPTGQHVVILKEREAERFLPIWIGVAEANAIAIKITGIVPDRPITHDLIVSLFEQLRVEVSRIVVTSLDNDVYFARIVGQVEGRKLDLDARPSDAIALAVRLGSPIYVAREVLEKAAVLPEADADAEQERLRVFQEMVNSMDLPDLDAPHP